MSRLDELISQYCPNGVPFQPLGNVCEIRSGWGFPNVEQGKVEGEFPFFKVGDMNNNGNEMFMYTANNYINDDVVKKLKCKPAPAGTIIFPKIGAAIGTNKKRILVNETKAARNKAIRSRVKTSIKKVEAAVTANDKAAAQAAVKEKMGTL